MAGALASEARQSAGDVEQLLERRALSPRFLVHVDVEQVESLFEQGAVEALLAREVVVDRADGDVRLVGDLVDLGRLEAVLEEVALGGVEDGPGRAGLAALRSGWRLQSNAHCVSVSF